MTSEVDFQVQDTDSLYMFPLQYICMLLLSLKIFVPQLNGYNLTSQQQKKGMKRTNDSHRSVEDLYDAKM